MTNTILFFQLAVIINIDFFAYDEADANALANSIKTLFPVNYIYVRQENMRYYVRGMVWTIAEQNNSYIQLFQLADQYNCCSDFYAEVNFKMAG